MGDRRGDGPVGRMGALTIGQLGPSILPVNCTSPRDTTAPPLQPRFTLFFFCVSYLHVSLANVAVSFFSLALPYLFYNICLTYLDHVYNRRNKTLHVQLRNNEHALSLAFQMTYLHIYICLLKKFLNLSHRLWVLETQVPTRQDRTAILDRILPIFRSFSTDFMPKMVPHPCYIYISVVLVQNMDRKTQAWYPICHFSAHRFTDSAYFPPNLPLILRWSCLAGQLHSDSGFIPYLHLAASGLNVSCDWTKKNINH